MLDLIGALRGEAMANEVANALVHSRRNAEVEQRSARLDMESDGSPLAGLVVRLMQENLDFELSLTELAEAVEIPPRTLFYLCNQVSSESLMKLNLKVCLQAAKKSPFYEDRSIKDVGLA
jgi:transcriptional regulator GlxA family with amidase domain